MTDDVRDDWDDHWRSLGDASLNNPANGYRRRLVSDLLGHPTPGSLILDIGSGQGELTLFLQAANPACDVVGVEYSTEGVHRATETAAAAGSRVRFVQADLLQPVADGLLDGRKADYAVCSEVLEHVDDPACLLRNAARCLAPSCRLVVTVPGGPRSALDRHIGHRQHFRPETLQAVLDGAGFRVEKVLRAGFPFFDLYKLALILRGSRLVDDLQSATMSDARNRLSRAVVAVFSALFRLNLRDSPFGWQMVAVAQPTSRKLTG
jgi:SAM-dependent methyltransferase